MAAGQLIGSAPTYKKPHEHIHDYWKMGYVYVITQKAKQKLTIFFRGHVTCGQAGRIRVNYYNVSTQQNTILLSED